MPTIAAAWTCKRRSDSGSFATDHALQAAQEPDFSFGLGRHAIGMANHRAQLDLDRFVRCQLNGLERKGWLMLNSDLLQLHPFLSLWVR
jgi:hypothetical protein